MKKFKIKTFSKTGTKTGAIKQKTIIDPEIMFRRSLGAISSNNFDLETAMSFELAHHSPALFDNKGSVRKTTKSDLATVLEAKIQNIVVDEMLIKKENTLYIIDFMALIRRYPANAFNSFNHLGKTVLNKCLNALKFHRSVAICFDRYDNVDSIKTQERERRSKTLEGIYSVKGSRAIQPNLCKFLQNSVNKTNLSDFVCNYFEEHRNELPEFRNVFLSGGYLDPSITKNITKYNIVVEEDLSNCHEEADTRIIHLLTKLYLSYEVIFCFYFLLYSLN